MKSTRLRHLALRIIAMGSWAWQVGHLDAEDQTAIASRFNEMLVVNSLDLAGVKPWHLKISYTLVDEKGATTGEGMVEEWWAGPNLHRTVYTGSGYSATELTTKDGEYTEGDHAAIPSPVDLLADQVVHPGPADDGLAGSQLDMRTGEFGKVKLDCVMVVSPIKGVSHPPIGLFPTYCLQTGSVLRATYNFGSLLFIRNGVGTFQGHIVPIVLNASVEGKEVLRAKVEVLQEITPAAGEFEPTSTMAKTAASVATVSTGVVAGRLLHKVTPFYPERAKQQRISGKVVLRALIGTDGRIRRLEVMSTPDGDLAVAALAGVRQWRYQPYLLNGVATRVDTSITVNFGIDLR